MGRKKHIPSVGYPHTKPGVQESVPVQKQTENAPAPKPARLTVNAGRLVLGVFLFCAGMELFFWLLDYHVNYGRFTELGPIRRMCNLAREDGLGSWFGTTQTFLVGLTAGVLYLLTRATPSSRRQRSGWLLLTLFFVYMAVDDGAEIHERMGTVFKTLNRNQTDTTGQLTLGAKLLEYFPSYSWQIVFIPFFATMGIFMAVFTWLELKGTWGRILVLAAIGCFVIGVSFDYVEGLDEDHPANLYTILADTYDIEEFTQQRFQHTGYDTLRHFSKTTEEALEMLGMTLLWIAFLRHLPNVAGRIEIRLLNPARQDTRQT